LDQGYTEKSRCDYVAQARRLERHYGNLDKLYDQDRFAALIGQLRYSKDDQRNARPNPARFPIVGDLYGNLSTYRSTLRCYARFRAAEGPIPLTPPSAPPPSPRWWQRLRRLSARC